MAILTFALDVNIFFMRSGFQQYALFHLTGIVIHVWAENNSSPALNAPFSNEITTNNFQTEKHKGSS